MNSARSSRIRTFCCERLEVILYNIPASSGDFPLSDERDIQLFVKKCRDEILPVLDENLIALIELVAELLDPDKQFPSLSRRRVSSRKRKVALNLLRESFDWTATDVSILGVLYESLLDSVDENASKQGRSRRGGIFYTP